MHGITMHCRDKTKWSLDRGWSLDTRGQKSMFHFTTEVISQQTLSPLGNKNKNNFLHSVVLTIDPEGTNM